MKTAQMNFSKDMWELKYPYYVSVFGLNNKGILIFKELYFNYWKHNYRKDL